MVSLAEVARRFAGARRAIDRAQAARRRRGPRTLNVAHRANVQVVANVGKTGGTRAAAASQHAPIVQDNRA